MAFVRRTLLRRAAITAVLAGGLGAGTATVAMAATQGSTPSASTSTTSATSPSRATAATPPAAPRHNCPHMGSGTHGSPGSGSASSTG